MAPIGFLPKSVMHRPLPRLVRMVIALLATASLVFVLYGTLVHFFLANPVINGIIAAVFLLGAMYQFRCVLMLYAEIVWVEGWRMKNLALRVKPKLLAPIAAVLGAPGKELNLSALSVRSLLDGIGSRLTESREISHYSIGLLIFLGLLGTFWGLLQTLSAISGVIDGLGQGVGQGVGQGGVDQGLDGGLSQGARSDLDPSLALEQLLQGLSLPLSGMSTAFSSSLFGLSGSLILGFLHLQVSQAQNRFFNDLEEWFAGVTHLGRGGNVEDDVTMPAYMEALLGQTNENLEKLIGELRSGHRRGDDSGRAIEQLLQRLGTDMDRGRKEVGEQIRNEIRLLARTLARTYAQDARREGEGSDDPKPE